MVDRLEEFRTNLEKLRPLVEAYIVAPIAPEWDDLETPYYPDSRYANDVMSSLCESANEINIGTTDLYRFIDSVRIDMERRDKNDQL